MQIDPGLFERFNARIATYLATEGINEFRQAILDSGIQSQSGALLNSVRYIGETEPGIHQIGADAEHASFLDKGYEGYDMKPGLMGKIVPIKTPGGVIFRRVGPNSQGWWHPGGKAYGFGKTAKERMERSIIRVVEDLVEVQPEIY